MAEIYCFNTSVEICASLCARARVCVVYGSARGSALHRVRAAASARERRMRGWNHRLKFSSADWALHQVYCHSPVPEHRLAIQSFIMPCRDTKPLWPRPWGWWDMKSSELNKYNLVWFEIILRFKNSKNWMGMNRLPRIKVSSVYRFSSEFLCFGCSQGMRFSSVGLYISFSLQDWNSLGHQMGFFFTWEPWNII